MWALLREPKYKLRALFMMDTEPIVPVIWFQMEKLIETHLPKLGDAFEKAGVMSSMYMTEWFMVSGRRGG